MLKCFHEKLKEAATKDEIESCTIYGQLAIGYTKEELIAFIVWQGKESRERTERQKHDYGFLNEIQEARIKNLKRL
jgi:hypothetical protein